MKKLTLLATLFLSAAAVLAVAQEEVEIAGENVFVPLGFDSNDQVEFVVNGYLPNTCYRRPTGEAKVENQRIEVDLKATRITDPNVLCIMAVVPYTVTVRLGKLTTGEYSVVVNAGALTEKQTTLVVSNPGTSSIDNHTYANVSSVENGSNPGEIVIKGHHPSSCMVLESIQVIPNKTGDTFSVLPIVKQSKPLCDRSYVPFSYNVQLPTNLAQSLAHVRILDGNAINFPVIQ